MAVQRLFQPASAFLSAGLGVFCAGTATQCPAEPSGRRASIVGVLVKHMELRNRRSSTHSRVRPEPWCARSPRAPACVNASRGPSTFITTLVALPQGAGVKRTMLPMPGPRAMAALVSCYRVVQVDVCALFDKGWTHHIKCSQRFARRGSDPFDRVRGFDALPRWDPPARHPRLAWNTA